MKRCQHVQFDCNFATIFGVRFKKNPQGLAQNGFSVQKPKQKAYENTNPKGISGYKQEEEEDCCSGLATLTGQELCSACSWELILISTCTLTTSQELVVSPGSIHLLHSELN